MTTIGRGASVSLANATAPGLAGRARRSQDSGDLPKREAGRARRFSYGRAASGELLLYERLNAFGGFSAKFQVREALDLA